MAARSTWQNLPPAVRAAIERETGRVSATESPTAGRNSDFSATLHTPTGPVFCKGIANAASERGRMHRHESAINTYLPHAIAPPLRWRAEADGWLLLGFEHVTGRHADLAPGSGDLTDIATTVNTLVADLSHCSAEAPRLAEQWDRLAAWRRLTKDPDTHLDNWTHDHLDQLARWEARAIELADGNSLVHTDLHALNILVTPHRPQIVDWAWSRKGAAAIDVAFLVARLIAAGHTPPQAEKWADTLPVWRDTTAETRTAFAVAIWGIWTYQSTQQPRPLWDKLVPAAQAWTQHRLAANGRPFR